MKKIFKKQQTYSMSAIRAVNRINHYLNKQIAPSISCNKNPIIHSLTNL